MSRFPLNIVVFLVLLAVMPATAARHERVANAPEDICPLLIGSRLPELPVKALDGKPFDLIASVKAKPTVLIYFRGGW